MFNYSTTDFALRDLLGDLKFFGIYWATILTIAFCGIDFAGITRLFVADVQENEQRENWLLFGAWFLAATMNAILTWWGVAMSLTTHTIQSTSFVESKTISQIVPIFVAIMVWLTRILLIGSFSMKARSRGSMTTRRPAVTESRRPITNHSNLSTPIQQPQMSRGSFKSASAKPQNRVLNQPEPEYISEPGSGNSHISYNAQKPTNSNTRRF
jgi:hypothetical protein